MNKVSLTLWAVFLILLLGLIYLERCGSELKDKEPELKVDTFFLPADTVKRTVKQYIPKYDTIIQNDTFYKYRNVDTAKILTAYFSQYVFNDSVDIKNLRVYIHDTISENQIKNRKIEFKELVGTMVIVKEKPAPKQSNLKLYIGGEGAYYDYKGDKWAGLGPSAVLTTKRNAIGYSYDILSNGHQVQVLWLLSFKK